MSVEPAIIVRNVKKQFKIPLDKTSGIKQLIVNFYKRKKGYRQLKALDGISFEVKKGEFFGVVGRNGSGKSTLLKILAGVYNPDHGNVQVNGSLTPFIELGVGFNHELTGRENVFLNGALLGFSRKEMEEMYDEIVDFAELHEFMEERLKNYSSGMQVRLAFSIAIRAKSDILVLDEVLAVGDAAFQQKCSNYFEQVKDSGQTVVLVSHNMDAVKKYCTRAVYIKNGKVHMNDEPSEIADTYIVDNALSNEGDKDAEYEEKHISLSITKDIEKTTLVKIKYNIPPKEECYVSLSLIYNLQKIAGINSDKEKPLKGRGSLSFEINKEDLNPDTYNIGAGLNRVSTDETIAVTGRGGRIEFIKKGNDKKRSAAIKLLDTWQY